MFRKPFFNFGNDFLDWRATSRIPQRSFRAAIEFFNLFPRQFRVVSVFNDVAPYLLRKFEAVGAIQRGINLSFQSFPWEFPFWNRRCFPVLETIHEFIPEPVRKFNPFIERKCFRCG